MFVGFFVKSIVSVQDFADRIGFARVVEYSRRKDRHIRRVQGVGVVCAFDEHAKRWNHGQYPQRIGAMIHITISKPPKIFIAAQKGTASGDPMYAI